MNSRKHQLKVALSNKAIHASGTQHRELENLDDEALSPDQQQASPWSNVPKSPWQGSPPPVTGRRAATLRSKAMVVQVAGQPSKSRDIRSAAGLVSIRQHVQDRARLDGESSPLDEVTNEESDLEDEMNSFAHAEAETIAKHLISSKKQWSEKTEPVRPEQVVIPEWAKPDSVVGVSHDHDLATIAEVTKYFWFCFETIKEDSESVYILRPEFISLCTSILRAGAESWQHDDAVEEASAVFADAIPKYLLVTQKMDFLMCTEAFSNLAGKHCSEDAAETRALWLALVGNRVLRAKRQPHVTTESAEATEYLAALSNSVVDNVRYWSKKHRSHKTTAYGSSQDVASICDPFAMSDLCEHVEILPPDDVERDPQFLPTKEGRQGMFGTEEAKEEEETDYEEDDKPMTPMRSEQEVGDADAQEPAGFNETEEEEEEEEGAEVGTDGSEPLRPLPPTDVISVVVTSPAASPTPAPALPEHHVLPRRHPPAPRRPPPHKSGYSLLLNPSNSWVCPFTLRLHRAAPLSYPPSHTVGRRHPRSAAQAEGRARAPRAGEEPEEEGEGVAGVGVRDENSSDLLQEHSIHGPLPLGGHLRRFSRRPSLQERSADHDPRDLHLLSLLPHSLLPDASSTPHVHPRLAPSRPPRSATRPRQLPPRPLSCDPGDGRRPWLLPTRVRFHPDDAPSLPPRPRSAVAYTQLADAPRGRRAGGSPSAGAGRRGSVGERVLPRPPVGRGVGGQRAPRADARERLQAQLALYARVKAPPEATAGNGGDGRVRRRRSSFADEKGVTWRSLISAGSQIY